MLRWGSYELGNEYAVDMAFCYKIRSVKDGVSFCNVKIEWDTYEADHKPSFLVQLILFNFVIFSFEIYRNYHSIFDSKRSFLKESHEEIGRSESKGNVAGAEKSSISE